MKENAHEIFVSGIPNQYRFLIYGLRSIGYRKRVSLNHFLFFLAWVCSVMDPWFLGYAYLQLVPIIAFHYVKLPMIACSQFSAIVCEKFT